MDFDDINRHYGHRLCVTRYGDEDNPDNVAIECETCNEVLFDVDSPKALKEKWGYKRDKYNRWAEDMEIGGWTFYGNGEGFGEDAEDYHGRGGYVGPAVECSSTELPLVMASSNVPSQCDNMGMGYVVYPA
jgi:hypothetical protein